MHKILNMSIFKKTILIIFLILNLSCSQSNSDDELETETEEISYLIVNDIRTNIGIDEITTGYPPVANKKNGVFTIFFSSGVNSLHHYFSIQITEEGKVISVRDYTETVSYFTRSYYNYKFFSILYHLMNL